MGEGVDRLYDPEYNELFSGLFKRYRPSMLRVARYFLENMEMAEDAVSEVFAKLWENRAELSKIRDPKNYLFILIKRKCLDEAAKFSFSMREDLSKTPPRLLVTAKNPETAYMNRELFERLAVSLQKLPDKCRSVFLMVKEDKLRYKEVADLLNISEKTVEMHVGNALKALRKDLAAYYTASKHKSKSISPSMISILLLSL